MKLVLRLLYALVLCMAAGAIQAQTQAVLRIVVGYPAGGSADTTARIVAERLGKELGNNVVVENVPGAAGLLARNKVLASPEDGSVLLLGSTSDVLADIVNSGSLKLLDSFVPLGAMASFPFVLAGRPTLEASNADELVRLARQPGKQLSIAAAGVGSSPHIYAELARRSLDQRMRYVPYKGSSQFLTDLQGGHVDLAVPALATVLPMIRSGKIRAYGLFQKARSPVAPDIPTLGEFDSLKTLEPFSESWIGLTASMKVPAETRHKLASALMRVAADKQTQQLIQQSGSAPVALSGEEVARGIRLDAPRLADFVKSANIKTSSALAPGHGGANRRI